jgi:putative heme-binding domain-containing protein
MFYAGPAAGQPLVAPTEALSPAEQQKKFHLPPGFEIQLVVAEPQIHKPMNITFDSSGRLWVTDTLEYPYPAKEGVTPRDTVKILNDTNGDGTADDVTIFVDGLNIPLGVFPVSDGVIVYGIPAVMHCRDTDGDGKADERKVLYGNFGNRDTHGMVNSFTRGLDGWLYACHGFSNDSAPVGSDGHEIHMNSGNTFRMRLDGSRVEYNTHGQVNPFGLSFDPLGNLYSADCHTMPIYTLLRGAYYPSFGKPDDGLGFGPTMIGHNHKSTGIGGIAYYAAEHFPSEYRDTIFIGNPVTGCVNHDRLKRLGSTYDCIEQPDFVTCDDPWFRPVNLQVGPDGALYIADFYNCIIGHYEVPLEHPRRDRERGRIWRVVYTGRGVENPPQTSPATAPNVHAAGQEELFALLGHPNLTVRTLATHEVVDRLGSIAVDGLNRLLAGADATSYQQIHAMWALERVHGLDAAQVDALAASEDPGVRAQLMKLLAERPGDDSSHTRRAVSDNDPFVRRAAADALARHPASENIPLLAKLWSDTPAGDTHLAHVTRMALRDQLLPDGAYEPIKLVVESEPALAEQLANVSLGVHTPASAEFVFRHLRRHPNNPTRDAYLHHVVRYLPEADLPAAFELAQGYKQLPLMEQVGIVRSLGRGLQERGAVPPAALLEWTSQLTGMLLTAESEGEVRAGIDLARDFRPLVFEAISTAASPNCRFSGLRPAALDVCALYEPAQAIPVLAGVLSAPGESLHLRQHAAAALGRIDDESARDELVHCLQTAPEGLALAIAAGLADTAQGGEALLATITAGKASARLLQEANVVDRLRGRKLNDFEVRLKQLTAKLPPADQRIKELIGKRRDLFASGQPDLAKGAAVFEKNCATCHRIGDKGAKIGPNLDGVGIRGIDRLLEDVLDPSRNVDQAFRTTQVVMADGRSLTGLVLREDGNILVLADNQGKEIRLPLDELEERALSPLSVMPANVQDLVSEADFVHLLGYLLSQRVEPATK